MTLPNVRIHVNIFYLGFLFVVLREGFMRPVSSMLCWCSSAGWLCSVCTLCWTVVKAALTKYGSAQVKQANGLWEAEQTKRLALLKLTYRAGRLKWKQFLFPVVQVKPLRCTDAPSVLLLTLWTTNMWPLCFSCGVQSDFFFCPLLFLKAAFLVMTAPLA